MDVYNAQLSERLDKKYLSNPAHNINVNDNNDEDDDDNDDTRHGNAYC